MMLRGPLLSSDKEIRSSALRTVRYSLNTVEDVNKFEDTYLPSLVVRIVDTNYDEQSFEDRVQALKLIRKLLTIGPSSIPKCLLTSLISIVNCSSPPYDQGEKNQVRFNLPIQKKIIFIQKQLYCSNMLRVTVYIVLALKSCVKPHFNCHRRSLSLVDSICCFLLA